MGKSKPKYSFYDSGDKAHSFINPYTFVRLNTTDKSEDNSAGTQESNPVVREDDDEIVTGKLTCRLYLRTPLIIPDTDCSEPDSENKKHLHYPFMRIDGECIIPGSSIRGPVRSMYETITNSCFSTMQYRQKITARTNKPFLPGLLLYKNGSMKLIAANRYRIRMDPKDLSEAKKPDAKCTSYSREELLRWGYGAHLSFSAKTITIKKTITKIEFENGKRKIKNNEIQIKARYVRKIKKPIYNEDAINEDTSQKANNGYLFIGEPIGNKHYESVFVPKSIDDKSHPSCSSDDIQNAYNNMKHAVDEYQNDSVNKNLSDSHSGYKHVNFRDFENGQIKRLPVWYKVDGSRLYLSLACIGRFTYSRTMEDIVPGHKPCDGSEPLCKACSLFGMIRKNRRDSIEDESGAYGSRLRFGDAKIIKPSVQDEVNDKLEEITLAELSSPKPSYLPFYLNSSDYTKGYDEEGATIKGRKFYWHHSPDLETAQEKEERNATMQYLADPAVFEFSVYFDDITKKQLRELEYVLCLGENKEDGDLCYKIGHGKPLGYGSVKICVVSEEIRSFDEGRYNIVKSAIDTGLKDKVPELVQGWPAGLNTVLSVSYINKYMSQAGYGVCYPRVDNNTGEPNQKIDSMDRNARAPHHWFSENYSFGRSKPKMYLPDIDEKELSLPALELIDMVDKYDVSCLKNGVGKQVPNTQQKQGDSLERNQIISVTISKIKVDDNDNNFLFGTFNYKGRKGFIKNIPLQYEKETEYEVCITNPKTEKGYISTWFIKERKHI